MMAKKALQVIAGAPDKPLVIGDIEIPCYVLEDETRVLVQRSMAVSLGMSLAGSGQRLTTFVGSNSIKPFISNDVKVGINRPVPFTVQGGLAHGYPAELLIHICKAILDARDAGALLKRQEHIAVQADILIRGCATVGIVALVDEATGYQEIRAKKALATILEEFIAQELQPWTKTFPYEFYKQIFRLKRWRGPDGVKRPSVIGRYTNDIVYARIAPGVLAELRAKNPRLPSGELKNKHHQWFTPDPGHPKLKEHLAAVTALMRAATTWDRFQRNLKRAFPMRNDQFEMDLGDD